MLLPEELQRGIQARLAQTDRGLLAHAAQDLSRHYRQAERTPALATPAHRAAYLAVRMPATYAANRRVLQEICRLQPDMAVHSLLDLGAGPGTSMWAAVEMFPDLKSITLLESDREMVEMGRQFAAASPHEAVRNAVWVNSDLSAYAGAKSAPILASHDLVVISYALGELPKRIAENLLLAAWQRTNQMLAIIEPGTPRNFEIILSARRQLMAGGAWMLAPCPHQEACPLATANDWCHFSVRLERTAEHRRLKDGDLGYEDEKFSYLIGSRAAPQWRRARIVRHPVFRPGHVQLTLCTVQGIERQTIGKGQKETYRAARNADWGDSWNFLASKS